MYVHECTYIYIYIYIHTYKDSCGMVVVRDRFASKGGET